MTTTATKIPYPSPADTGQMATDVDVALGAPIVPNNIAVLSAFGQAQSPTFPGWNLLGTELFLPGATPDPSNSAVYDYPTLTEGLQATVDMMLGQGPQTTPLETKFVTDLRTGTATKEQLTRDIYMGTWNGGSQDPADANAIASILGQPKFSANGSSGSGGSSGAGGTTATLTSAPGGVLDPLNWGSVGTSIGAILLKGVLTLMGAGLFLEGASLAAKKPELSPLSMITQLPKAAALAPV